LNESELLTNASHYDRIALNRESKVCLPHRAIQEAVEEVVRDPNRSISNKELASHFLIPQGRYAHWRDQRKERGARGYRRLRDQCIEYGFIRWCDRAADMKTIDRRRTIV